MNCSALPLTALRLLPDVPPEAARTLRVLDRSSELRRLRSSAAGRGVATSRGLTRIRTSTTVTSWGCSDLGDLVGMGRRRRWRRRAVRRGALGLVARRPQCSPRTEHLG